MALVPVELKGGLPTAHLDEGLNAEGIFLADHGESLSETFNEQLLT